MRTGLEFPLAVLLLAAALASTGCNESHAPAATGPSAAAGRAAAPDVSDGDSPAGAKDRAAASSTKRPDESPANAPAPAKSSGGATTPPRGVGGGTSDITFDTIKFAMEKTDPFMSEMLTPAIRALDGRRIRVRGYMLPSFQQSGITQFVLVRDNLQCCFGPGAALYDCIVVEMTPGKSTEYKVQPVAVEGTFSLSELRDPDGKHLAIYRIAGDLVK